MMSVRRILLALVIALLCQHLPGEVYKSRTALGMHAGTSTGIGYAMRFMQDAGGFQATFGAYALKRESSVSLGLNGIGVIDNFKTGRFYIIGGGTVRFYHKETVDWYTDQYVEKNQTRWCIGAGPGVELAIYKNIRIAFELPITYNWKNELIMYIPQGGIYYYFK